MKFLLIITALTLSLGMFAQGPSTNYNPPAQASQMQFSNYNNQIDINNYINPVQTNLGNQQANPPAQVQQQTSGSIFGSEENNQVKTTKCKDCDAIKKAIRESHASSGSHYRTSFNIKKWGNKFSGRMRMKMQKMFAHRKKIRTNYEICFNWG